MTIITVSRQSGSFGTEIARIAAVRLGYRLVSRQIINQAANQICKPELALAEIDELGLLQIKPSPKECKSYKKAVKKIIKELAAKDNVVILGRAGQVILRHHPAAIHIRIIAPKDIRTARIMEKHQIPIKAAKAQIQASDNYRKKYLKKHYHVKVSNPELYDLVINTANFDIESSVNLIRYALHTKFPAPTHPLTE